MTATTMLYITMAIFLGLVEMKKYMARKNPTLDCLLIQFSNMLLTTAYVQYYIRTYYYGRGRGRVYHVLMYLLCLLMQFVLLFMFVLNYRLFYQLPLSPDHCPK